MPDLEFIGSPSRWDDPFAFSMVSVELLQVVIAVALPESDTDKRTSHLKVLIVLHEFLSRKGSTRNDTDPGS